MDEEFPEDRTVIIFNMREAEGELVDDVCHDLTQRGLELTNIQHKRCLRLKSKTNKPGIIKMEMKTLQDKICVLRAKSELQRNGYPNVYIRAAQTHEQRIARTNMMTMLKILPNGKDYRLTGHGKLIYADEADEDVYHPARNITIHNNNEQNSNSDQRKDNNNTQPIEGNNFQGKPQQNSYSGQLKDKHDNQQTEGNNNVQGRLQQHNPWRRVDRGGQRGQRRRGGGEVRRGDTRQPEH